MNRYTFSSHAPKAVKKVKWKSGTKWRLYDEDGRFKQQEGYTGIWTLLKRARGWMMAWQYDGDGATGWVLGPEIAEETKADILSRYYQI
jgi:hypothetical protein